MAKQTAKGHKVVQVKGGSILGLLKYTNIEFTTKDIGHQTGSAKGFKDFQALVFLTTWTVALIR